eukprot:187348-Alexandrium_andersonii.AAC.1
MRGKVPPEVLREGQKGTGGGRRGGGSQHSPPAPRSLSPRLDNAPLLQSGAEELGDYRASPGQLRLDAATDALSLEAARDQKAHHEELARDAAL